VTGAFLFCSISIIAGWYGDYAKFQNLYLVCFVLVAGNYWIWGLDMGFWPEIDVFG
jgi:hypothetical protein